MKLLICKRVSSRKLRLLALKLSDSTGGLGDAVEALVLCGGERVGGFGEDDSEGGRGEDERDNGLGDEQRESGLGDEEETDGGLGEEDRLSGLGEEDSDRGCLVEDTRGTGEASLRDWVTSARGLALAASPVAWMTLRCCLGLSSLGLEPEKRRAGGWCKPED